MEHTTYAKHILNYKTSAMTKASKKKYLLLHVEFLCSLIDGNLSTLNRKKGTEYS